MQKLLDVLPKIQFLQQDFFHRDKTVDVTISFFLVSLTLATLILLWSKRLNPKIRPKYYAPKHEKAYEEKWRICLDEELRNTLEQETRNVSITVLSQSHQFENFVAKHIMGENTFSSKLSANVSIIAIGIDEGSKDETLYVWLRVEWEGERNIFCIPLEEFGLALAAIMEIQLTTASFVFVCDASSGLGSEIIEAIAKESLGMVSELEDIYNIDRSITALFLYTTAAHHFLIACVKPATLVGPVCAICYQFPSFRGNSC